jgi:Bacterial Ig-like domain (group 2)/GDSL-like Lipase/Acylhydrolase family
MPVHKPPRPGAGYYQNPPAGLKPQGRPGRLVLGTALPPTTPAGPTLVSIAVTPAAFAIFPGATLQFTALGTFSDSSTSDITSSATWSSTATSAATIAAGGLATAVANGSTTIHAISSGITGSTSLTVSQAGIQPAFNVIQIGDSIAQGITGVLTEDTPMYALYAQLAPFWGVTPNLGLPGAAWGHVAFGSVPPIDEQLTTKNLGTLGSPSGQQCVSPGRPQILLTQGGVNNVLSGDSAAATLTYMAAGVAAWTSYLAGISTGGFGVNHILVVHTPTAINNVTFNPVLVTLASLIRGVASFWATSNCDIVIADLSSLPHVGLAATSGDFTTYFQPDGIHPNAAGYAIIAPAILAALGGLSGLRAKAALVGLPNFASDALTTLPGPLFWYRVGATRVSTDGAVGCLDDLFGNGKSIMCGFSNTGGSPPDIRPTYDASHAACGNKPAMVLSGHQGFQGCNTFTQGFADQFPGNVVLSSTTPYTFYFVLNNSALSTVGICATDNGAYLWTDGSGSNFYRFGNGSADTNVPSGATMHVLCCVADGSTVAIYIDDHATPKGTYAGNPGAFVLMFLGALGGSSTSLSDAMTGAIAEFAGFTVGHNTAQRFTGMAGLGAEYSLPVT